MNRQDQGILDAAIANPYLSKEYVDRLREMLTSGEPPSTIKRFEALLEVARNVRDHAAILAETIVGEICELEGLALLDSKPQCHFCKAHYNFPGELRECVIPSTTQPNVFTTICHTCLHEIGEDGNDRAVHYFVISPDRFKVLKRRCELVQEATRRWNSVEPTQAADPIAIALDQIEADPPFEATGAKRSGTAYEHGPPIEETTLTEEREGIRLRSFRDDQQSRRKAAAQTVSHVLGCPYNRTELLTRLRKCDLCPNWCFGKYCDDCVSKYAEKPSQQCADCREVFHQSKMVELLFSGNCQGFVCEKCAAPDGSPARTIARLEERWAKKAHDKAAKTAD